MRLLFRSSIDGSTVVIPYPAQEGMEEGHVTRPSINAVLQWKPSDNLDFILEGGYLGSREKRSVERLYVQDIPFKPAGRYSDVVLMPDGTTVKSLRVSNPNGIAAGIDPLYNSFHSNLSSTHFEAPCRGARSDKRCDGHESGSGVSARGVARKNKK